MLDAAAAWSRHGWEGGAHFSAALSIVRVEQLIRQSNDQALRPLGLTHARHEALALLYFSRNGHMPLGKLGQRLMVHPTSVTSTVDALERLSLVERTTHPTDRRATLACITPKGRATIEASCQAMADARSGLEAMSERQAKTLFSALRAVRSAAGDIPRATRDGARVVDPLHRDPVLAAAAHWTRCGWSAGPYFTAALSILRVEQLIRQSNEQALRPHRLTHARHEALALLYFSRNGHMPLGKLGQRLMVHPTSVTSTVDALERSSLVERATHPTDRRTTLACITPKGRAAIEQSCQLMAEARFGLGVLSDRQCSGVSNALRPVRVAAGDVAGAR